MNEARDEFLQLTQNEASEDHPIEAPPSVEEISYFLNNKESKLPVNAEFSFKEGGKSIKAPLQAMLNEYRRRQDLEKRYGGFKKEREEFDAQRKQYGELEPYLALQKWSVENPKDWDYLYKLYQDREKHTLTRDTGNGNEALVEKISALEKQLGELRDFRSSMDAEREEKLDHEAVSEIEQEVATFKKEFPEINLDEEKDGRTLRDQIILYGVDRRIPNFELAAMSFLKPRLTEILSSRGRKEVSQNVIRDRSKGVIGRFPTPQGVKGEVNSKKLSWNEATNLAKAEFLSSVRG